MDSNVRDLDSQANLRRKDSRQEKDKVCFQKGEPEGEPRVCFCGAQRSAAVTSDIPRPLSKSARETG